MRCITVLFPEAQGNEFCSPWVSFLTTAIPSAHKEQNYSHSNTVTWTLPGLANQSWLIDKYFWTSYLTVSVPSSYKYVEEYPPEYSLWEEHIQLLSFVSEETILNSVVLGSSSDKLT